MSTKPNEDGFERIVILAGEFIQNSLESGVGRHGWEGAQRRVLMLSFTIGMTAAVFIEWDAFEAASGFSFLLDNRGPGRVFRPALNVSWEDAQQYTACRNFQNAWVSVVVLARRKLHLGLSVRHEHEDKILGEAV